MADPETDVPDNLVELQNQSSKLPSRETLVNIREELLDFEQRRATLRGEHAQRMGVVKEDQVEYLEKLASKGMNTKAIKKWFAVELLEIKKKKLEESVNEADQPYFEHIVDQMDLFPDRDLKRAS